MLKKFLPLLVVFFQVHASATPNFGYSSVFITNDSDSTLEISPELATTDSNFHKGSDWDGDVISLEPYETKKIIWFSRNSHVKKDIHYTFNLIASRKDSADKMLFTFDETGHQAYGSLLRVNLKTPNQSYNDILHSKDIEKFQLNISQKPYTIFANSYLALGNIFDDFHFVIHQTQINEKQTDLNNQLSVLTYNTQLMPFYANVVDDLNHASIRSKDIPQKITGYDVVILEELFDHKLRQTIIDRMQSFYPYHTKVVGEGTKNILTGGVVIFSKWPIAKEDQIIYSSTADEDGLADKGAVYARIIKNKMIYHIFGTHLQAGGKSIDAKVRQFQLQQLSNFIDRLNIPTDQPVLVGGDFNIDQFGPEYNTLLSSLPAVELENTGYPYSMDTFKNTMAVGGAWHGRIDYVFYHPFHAKPKSAFNHVFVLRDLDNQKMWPKFDLSDHFPVWSYFEF